MSNAWPLGDVSVDPESPKAHGGSEGAVIVTWRLGPAPLRPITSRDGAVSAPATLTTVPPDSLLTTSHRYWIPTSTAANQPHYSPRSHRTHCSPPFTNHRHWIPTSTTTNQPHYSTLSQRAHCSAPLTNHRHCKYQLAPLPINLTTQHCPNGHAAHHLLLTTDTEYQLVPLPINLTTQHSPNGHTAQQLG